MAYEDCMEYSKNGWFALHRVNNKTRLSPVTIRAGSYFVNEI
jgi:hypothetical protein